MRALCGLGRPSGIRNVFPSGSRARLIIETPKKIAHKQRPIRPNRLVRVLSFSARERVYTRSSWILRGRFRVRVRKTRAAKNDVDIKDENTVTKRGSHSFRSSSCHRFTR